MSCDRRGAAVGSAAVTNAATAAGNAGELSRAWSPRTGRRVMPAAFNLAALNADQVRLTFIGHATFLIESPQLVRIATDYNDYVQAAGRARHRHHEPCPRHPLHRSSRSGDQIRAARLGAEPRRAGDLGSEISRRARAQRADQYPRLGPAAPSATAIRSSFSRSPICASRISAICITR